MNSKEENVCRLCFRNNVRCRYEEIDDTTRDILDALMVNMNLDVCRDAVICSECVETVLRCLRFKLDCFRKEQQLLRTTINKAENEINSKNMLGSTEMPSDDITGICTFCLDPANSNLSYVTDTLKHSEVVRLLPIFVPEKKFLSIDNSKICSICGTELAVYLTFLFNCMKTEEKVKGHLLRSAEKGPINLRDIHDESKVKKYQCSYCQFETKWKESLRSHTTTQHPHNASEVMKYQCSSCEFETKWKDRLNTHMGIQHDAFQVKNYKCPHCTFETKWKGYLNTHIKIQHNALEATIYKCSNCTYETKWKAHLNAHMKMQHSAPNVNKYKCSNCTFETKWKNYLNTHFKMQHNALEATKYKCSHCTYETKWKSYLNAHMENQHNEHKVKKYKCSNCTYETKWKKSLSRHLILRVCEKLRTDVDLTS